jgi:hypothetical protein
MAVTVTYCKRRLAAAWFVGAGVVFFVVLIQSMLGRYGEDVNEAWGWLLPTVMPTLSLIIGVLVFDAMRTEDPTRTIDKFLFRLTLGLSISYLSAVLLVIALQPFAKVPALQLMTEANIWLGPFQGLVAAALGAFFVKAAQDGASVEKGPAASSASGRAATS